MNVLVGGLFNPAALPYPETLYLDPRFQSILRSNPHALYSQLQSPYASHLYGGASMPGVFPNLNSLHEKMKLEEEYRARLVREEEKAREQREREQREKELREKEQREKEEERKRLLEKEMREKEHREKEMREREHREKELREREKIMQQQQQAFMNSQRSPYNLLSMFSPMLHQMRPSMHPGYAPLLGLSLPSSMPPTPTISMSLPPHPSQSQSSIPISVSSNMSSLMSPLGLSHHGVPPDSYYHRISTLPPPAHLSHYSYHNNPSSPHSSMLSAATSAPVIRSSSISTQSTNNSKNSLASASQQRENKEKNNVPVNVPSNSNVPISPVHERKLNSDITNGSNKHETAFRKDEKLAEVVVAPREEMEVEIISGSSPRADNIKEEIENDENPRVDCLQPMKTESTENCSNSVDLDKKDNNKVHKESMEAEDDIDNKSTIKNLEPCKDIEMKFDEEKVTSKEELNDENVTTKN